MNGKVMAPSRGLKIIKAEYADGKRRLWKIHLLSFLLPILLMIPGFIYAGIFPFGDRSTLTVDLNNQYIGFFEGLRQAIHDPSGFFYNFTKSLGGEMALTYAYTLASPLNLLLFLLPAAKLPYMVILCQLLKIGLAGLNFSFLLVKREHGYDGRVVLLSTAYALCSFITTNMLNLMWLDTIALFPLLVLFLEQLLDGGNPLPYTFLLALSIWVNFYMGYMVCIFLVVYCLYSLIRRRRLSSYSKKGWFGHQTGLFFRFAFYSLLAALLTAALIFPTIQAMKLSKGTYSKSLVDAPWEFRYAPWKFFSKLLPAAFNWDEVPSGLPNVFTGSFTLILAFLYFFNKRISRRERAASFLVLLFLFLSMTIKRLIVLWHGMQYPIWFEYRFSWLFSFFLALLAFRSLMRTEKLSLPPLILYILISAAFLIFFTLHLKELTFLSQYHIIAMAVAIPLLFFLYDMALSGKSPKKKRGASLLLALLFLLEFSLDAAFHTGTYSYERMSSFATYDREMQTALKDIRPADNQFWRIEKTFRHDDNDGMRFNFPNLTHFNSGLERKSIDLMTALGFATTSNSITGTNPTLFTDAFFGIRYYMDSESQRPEVTDGTLRGFQDAGLRPDLETMRHLFHTDYITAYENTDTMPLGMMAEEGLEDLQSNHANPLDYQEKLANLLDGKGGDINYFERLPMGKPQLKNMEIESETSSLTTYRRLDSDKEETASLLYRFRTKPGHSNYITVSNTLNKNNSRLYLDEEEIPNKRMGTHHASQVYNVSSRKNMEQERQLEVKMDKEKDSFSVNNISLFSLDNQALEEACRFQNARGLALTRMSNTDIEGTILAEENTPYLLFTIPYDKGWTVTIDGEKAESLEVLSSLLAVPVSPGPHTVHLHYELPGFKLGCQVSLAALALLMICGLIYWLRKRRKAKKQSLIKAEEDSAEDSPERKEEAETESQQPLEEERWQEDDAHPGTAKREKEKEKDEALLRQEEEGSTPSQADEAEEDDPKKEKKKKNKKKKKGKKNETL